MDQLENTYRRWSWRARRSGRRRLLVVTRSLGRSVWRRGWTAIPSWTIVVAPSVRDRCGEHRGYKSHKGE